MGTLAARGADSGVPDVSLGRAGPLPAGRRGGGQHRRPGRRAGPVPGLHARRHRPAVERGRAAVRAAGRVLLRRVVRRARHDPAPGSVRDLRRDVGVPGRAGGLVRDPRRGPGTGDQVDGRGGGRPGAGQCHGLYLVAVRPAHRRARPAYHALDRPRLARGPARRDRAGRHGRAAGRRTGGRREQLPGRFPADDADPGPWLGLPAAGARPVLVLGRPAAGPGGLRRRHQLGRGAAPRRPRCSRSCPPPWCSGRWSRRTCIPWPR